MSLFQIPVSANDILNLQFGITFRSNMALATAEAADINAGGSTVFELAKQLLNSQLAFSQVAMAVSSLMEGQAVPVGEPNTPTSLVFFSTVFLPPQAAVATTFNFVTTVF